MVRFRLFSSGIYISYWLPSMFIDSQRSVLHLAATHVNKQYIREPHQSWYKSVIHLNLGIYIVSILEVEVYINLYIYKHVRVTYRFSGILVIWKIVWDSWANINNSVIFRLFVWAASSDVAQAQNIWQRCYIYIYTVFFSFWFSCWCTWSYVVIKILF